MTTKKFTVTTTAINTGSEQSSTVSITDASSIYLEPSTILFVNNTAAEIGIISLSSDDEVNYRTANASLYDYISIATGSSYLFNLSSSKYIKIIKLSGTATADLNFYAINYRGGKV